MKRSRYTETQIIKILQEAEAGVAIGKLSPQIGLIRTALYNWKAKYGGIDVAALKRLKELGVENQKLKEMYSDLSLGQRTRIDFPNPGRPGSRT